jgi:AcrR family transcriptional regulator
MSDDEITKEKILSACKDRFMREGFARVSVDEISNELAMSKKTFYKHFSSKEDLVQQIVERFMGEIRGNIERILLSENTAVEKLSETMTTIAMAAGKVLPFFGQDVRKRLPDLWKRIEEFRRERISEIFNRLIDQGIREGYMRQDLNRRVLLLCLFSAVDGIVQPHVLAAESFSVSEGIRGILNIFFRGVLTQSGVDQFDRLTSRAYQPQ